MTVFPLTIHVFIYIWKYEGRWCYDHPLSPSEKSVMGSITGAYQRKLLLLWRMLIIKLDCLHGLMHVLWDKEKKTYRGNDPWKNMNLMMDFNPPSLDYRTDVLPSKEWWWRDPGKNFQIFILSPNCQETSCAFHNLFQIFHKIRSYLNNMQ